MEFEWTSINDLISGAIGGGAITALISAIVNRKRSKAEVESITAASGANIANTAMKMVDRLQGEVNEMKSRQASLTHENVKLTQEITSLRTSYTELASELKDLRANNVELEKFNNLLLRDTASLRLQLEDCIRLSGQTKQS